MNVAFTDKAVRSFARLSGNGVYQDLAPTDAKPLSNDEPNDQAAILLRSAYWATI
jgi:hypothetical protein